MGWALGAGRCMACGGCCPSNGRHLAAAQPLSLARPSTAVTYTRFALCPTCYQHELAGQGKGLPPGMELGQLLAAPNRVTPPVAREEGPPRECEFFDTRTVRGGGVGPSCMRA